VSRRARDLSLSLVALAAGMAVAFAVTAVAPVDAAAPQTASVTAVDNAWEAASGNTATIAAGGTVAFSYPDGADIHNVVFTGGTSPKSCTQTAGPMTGPVPPLPAGPTGPGWSGTCHFNAPGTYTFVCAKHSSMTGSVVVEGASTTGTTTTGSTTGTTPTGTTTTGTTPAATTPGATTTAPGSSASRLAPRVSVARRQRGTVLRGTVTTPAGRSRIVVTALISNRALAERRPKHVRRVRVGSQSKRSTGTGKTSFAVALNTAARRALQRRHRLDVGLRIVVTPPGARAFTTNVAVVLRERS
jgi:plastocyanin